MVDVLTSFEKVTREHMYMPQGTTYYNRWELLYDGVAFPFYSTVEGDEDTLLWSISASIRTSYLLAPDTSTDPLMSLEQIDTPDGLMSGVFIEKATVDDVLHTYYGIYILAEDTAELPAEKLWYNIKIKRISDDWTIRIREGVCTVTPDI